MIPASLDVAASPLRSAPSRRGGVGQRVKARVYRGTGGNVMDCWRHKTRFTAPVQPQGSVRAWMAFSGSREP